MSEFNKELYAAVQLEKPYKSYIKTILGQIYITILNPFNEEEITGLILKGNQRREKDKEACIIDVWSEVQDRFFKKMNKRHFENRRLIPYQRTETEQIVERTFADYSDIELLAIFKQPFAQFQKTINQIELPAVLAAMIELAENEGKISKRIFTVLESKLSELQKATYTTPDLEQD